MTDGLDLGRLGHYLAASGLAEGTAIEATLISGGRSNLTYLLHVDDHCWVLRRRPLGETLTREHTVIAALGPTDIPVPDAIRLCNDPEVIGARSS